MFFQKIMTHHQAFLVDWGPGSTLWTAPATAGNGMPGERSKTYTVSLFTNAARKCKKIHHMCQPPKHRIHI
jgi:hypothetical protein